MLLHFSVFAGDQRLHSKNCHALIIIFAAESSYGLLQNGAYKVYRHGC